MKNLKAHKKKLIGKPYQQKTKIGRKKSQALETMQKKWITKTKKMLHLKIQV